MVFCFGSIYCLCLYLRSLVYSSRANAILAGEKQKRWLIICPRPCRILLLLPKETCVENVDNLRPQIIVSRIRSSNASLPR